MRRLRSLQNDMASNLMNPLVTPRSAKDLGKVIA